MLAHVYLALLLLRTPIRPAVASPLAFQQVVDGIVVRIGDDLITLSELRELAAYQQLVDARSDSNEQLISELIDQWIVNNEASLVHFPEAPPEDVNREVARIESRFPSPNAYAARLSELGITADTVRRIVAQQIYFSRYLDYKFRPAVQVDDAAIEKYYRETLLPALAAKHEPAPPLSDVAGKIREILTLQAINERAEAWFEDTKSQLKIVIMPLAQQAQG